MITANKYTIALSFCAIALLVGGIVAHVRSDGYRIRRSFARLSAMAAVERGEGLLSKGAKSNSLAGLFAKEATLNTPVRELSGVFSRQDITRAAMAIKSRCERLSLEFFDLQIDVTRPGVAECVATARLRGKLAGGESFDETRELECGLVGESGQWLFSDCAVARIIAR